jgi:hypothetical protein
LVLGEGVEQRFRLALYQDHGTMFLTQKALCDHVVKEGEQRVVVATDVEQTAGFFVLVELRLGLDLEKLLQGAAAAGQCDKAFRELGHQRLALVHRADHAQICRPGVRDLAATSAFGMTPTASPPASRTASATTLKRPTRPPP